MKSLRIMAACAVTLLICGTLWADVGDLTYVKCDGSDALGLGPWRGGLSAGPDQFVAPPKDCGTVNPHATVVVIRDAGIAVAIDSAKADAPQPDLLRFDFTGKCKFDNECVLPLKAPNNTNYSLSLDPATIETKIDGRKVSVTLAGGMYQKQDTFRFMTLTLCVAAEGQCAFGDKTCKVRVIDGNSNARLGDAAKPPDARSRPDPGDTLLIDVGDGSFKKAVKAFCGQPVQVDGKWYEVAVNQADMKITAKPADVKVGQVKIDQDKWALVLGSDKVVMNFAGGKAAVDVPAGKYKLVVYTDRAAAKEEKPATAPAGLRERILTVGARDCMMGKARAIEVTEGKATDLAIGPPLEAGLEIQQTPGPVISFSLNLRDVGGSKVDSIALAPELSPGLGEIKKPKITVTDSSGNIVHTGDMEFG